jgi:hypothetical protein
LGDSTLARSHCGPGGRREGVHAHLIDDEHDEHDEDEERREPHEYHLARPRGLGWPSGRSRSSRLPISHARDGEDASSEP